MKKRMFVALALLLATASLAVAPVVAGVPVACCGAQARGDSQILSSTPEGSVVRVWIANPCRLGRFILVTVVTNQADGSLGYGQYTVYVPCFGTRPVDINVAGQVASVNKQIATALGAF